jgi:phosphoglycolate phosphatase
MNITKPWLVLFDIDDTLITRVGNQHVGLVRWKNALQQVFGITVDIDHFADYQRWNGWVDWQIGLDLVKPFGVGKLLYERKFPDLKEELYTQAIRQGTNGNITYKAIPEAKLLVKKISSQQGIHIGLLSGNLEKVGRWKLEQAGWEDCFPFGLFSDKVKDRMHIAKKVFTDAETFFNIKFNPNQITVIGDTVHDIRCGKGVGAHTIGYMSGRNDARGLLQKEGADLVVPSLTDQKVFHWFGITD